MDGRRDGGREGGREREGGRGGGRGGEDRQRNVHKCNTTPGILMES